jgi:hypothetical protein
MLGYAVLLRLNNVNAANQMPAHGARLWSDWLALQYYFRPELITVSALPWLTPGQSFLFGPCSSLPTIYSAEFVSGHLRGVHAMTNLLEQAINSNDGDAAAKLIQEALGIQRNDVVNYVFPKTWPSDREQRARIIGEWLQTEVRFLAS